MNAQTPAAAAAAWHQPWCASGDHDWDWGICHSPIVRTRDDHCRAWLVQDASDDGTDQERTDAQRHPRIFVDLPMVEYEPPRVFLNSAPVEQISLDQARELVDVLQALIVAADASEATTARAMANGRRP